MPEYGENDDPDRLTETLVPCDFDWTADTVVTDDHSRADRVVTEINDAKTPLEYRLAACINSLKNSIFNHARNNRPQPCD